MSVLTALSAGVSACPYSTGTRSTTPRPGLPARLNSCSNACSPSALVWPYRLAGLGVTSASYGASPGKPGKT